jgi:predicted CXXCH cytochrome family protein
MKQALKRLIVMGFWLLALTQASAAGVQPTKHNLSATGVGPLTAGGAGASTDMCVFCHTPHTPSAQRGLWNRYESAATYIPYKSTTSKATIGQPTGASKLCLSCHDGTIALGKLKSRPDPISLKGGQAARVTGRANLGTDLSDDHPISFKYDAALVAANGELNSPPLSGEVRVDHNSELQCTSCHDPHEDKFGKFLVINNTGSALCLTCHKPNYWRQSSHSLSTRAWNGNQPNPWPHTAEKSVSANACENCHSPHNAGGKQRLLNHAAEEQNCYACHNGNVAAKNVEAEFSKLSVHPVTSYTGVHDPVENPLLPEANRHIECADCHNPHAANGATSPLPGGANGSLLGVRGINASGGNVSQVTFEYELCFRCHADTAKGPSRIMRQFPQINTRLEFQIGSGTNSFHPVVMVGRNPNVPSLKSPWLATSRMACSDCHNSDTGANAGGNGPKGPHGSSYPPLLERPVSYADGGANPGNSALCFKCHDFSNLGWSRHLQHISMTSCLTCHDPHGSPAPHLINFNTTIVSGPRSYTPQGVGRPSCALICHGKTHDGNALSSPQP